ncbi:MAG TPA: tRNA (adenosine(37)-N6)-threonylcarbamoyltransferase complex dimerization subunit type 1 TsaB [Ktedonobacterales bacterium]|jgi:tRNA threonylcarbamoyladenosine biosynthesis protein TsaB|nr:tRNA (adenosine(37)-N6)-threonylcarbamoyltransferase complex dimerization subunit type 1 TsaB [Ktedonobacterales bacterium]
MLLAIDTSTNYASIALADDDTTLVELNWRVGQRHGAETLERVRWLLRGQNVEMAQLDGLAVALGPGSFNGVRVAVATAKTLAFALNIPIYGIPTLDVIAWGARLSRDPIWALLDAGRGEVYAACYDARHTTDDAPSGWSPRPFMSGDESGPYGIIAPETVAERVNGPVTITGEWRPATHAALIAALGERARFTSSFSPRRGAWLAELAAIRARRGASDNVDALEPLYLRRPNITTSARMPSAPEADRSGGEESAHAL